MKTLFRWILLTLTIGGGFFGFVTTLQLLLQPPRSSASLYFIVCSIFLLAYLFMLTSGLLFADKPQRTLPLMIAIILQIPGIACPWFIYAFSGGLRITIALAQSGFAYSYRLGSDWEFSLARARP